jgi:hypothetical protein
MNEFFYEVIRFTYYCRLRNPPRRPVFKTKKKKKTKLRDFSQQANYTDRATAACGRS